jgi:hypothetical protein
MVIVLEMIQSVGKLPYVMIIQDRERPNSFFFAFFPLVLHKVSTYEVPDGLRTIRIAFSADQIIESGQEPRTYRYTKPYQRFHAFTLKSSMYHSLTR